MSFEHVAAVSLFLSCRFLSFVPRRPVDLFELVGSFLGYGLTSVCGMFDSVYCFELVVVLSPVFGSNECDTLLLGPTCHLLSPFCARFWSVGSGFCSTECFGPTPLSSRIFFFDWYVLVVSFWFS